MTGKPTLGSIAQHLDDMAARLQNSLEGYGLPIAAADRPGFILMRSQIEMEIGRLQGMVAALRVLDGRVSLESRSGPQHEI
jgi:hypothetical protein